MTSQEDLEKQLIRPPEPIDLSQKPELKVEKTPFWKKLKLPKFKFKFSKGNLGYLILGIILTSAMTFYGIYGAFFKASFNDVIGSYTRSAQLRLASEESSVSAGDTFDVEIQLNTFGEDVYGTDIYLDYDTTSLEVVDKLSAKIGTQILPSELFSIVSTNAVYSDTGRIEFGAVEPLGLTISTEEFEPLATITFTALKDSSTTDISLYFDPELIRTDDCNVNAYLSQRETGDILASVENITIGLGEEETCSDNILNQDEEDIDCGGVCDPCLGPDSGQLKAEITKPSKNTEIEEGETIKFEGKVSGGEDPYEYFWDFDDSDIEESDELKTGNIEFEDAGEYKVEFTVIDVNGDEDSDTVSITVVETSEEKDSDGDGIPDIEEQTRGNDDYVTDPNKADSDGDGFEDLVEIRNYYVPVHDSRQSIYYDVNPAHPFYKYVEIGDHYDAIDGYPDGTFQPKNNITRAEALKMIVDGFGLQKQTCASLPFVDLPTEDHWVKEYVCTAYTLGIASGSGNLFRPWVPVTRAEFVKLLVNTKGISIASGGSQFSDVAGTEFDSFIKTAHDAELVSGYNPSSFGPWRGILREEAMKIIARAIRMDFENYEE
ncbi:MAG: S-layer homology domain-containing protein [Candidatus Gracilibacteria bacterium]|nr:S-layer homology domain-containing protein [Candidatus Gracilibacteria bacterium]